MEWAEIKALQEQGHIIADMGDSLLLGPLADSDIILAPNAWRMTEDLRPDLKLAIKAARKAKYGNAKAEEE